MQIQSSSTTSETSYRQVGSPTEENVLEAVVNQPESPRIESQLQVPISQSHLDGVISKMVAWNGKSYVADRDLVNGMALMGCLTEKVLELLCTAAEALFLSESMLVELSAPVVVVGNLYSHFHDLQRILRSNGLPPQRKYLFLGNAVTHGEEGIETMALLLALKVRYPHMCISFAETASLAMRLVCTASTSSASSVLGCGSGGDSHQSSQRSRWLPASTNAYSVPPAVLDLRISPPPLPP